MMPDDAILEIKHVSGLTLSADKTWQGDSNVYLELYRALVTSGMLASISGNALKALIALGLRARVLGGDAKGQSLFRHLMSLKLVSEADRGKLFCYATQKDLTSDCGLGSRNTLAQAIQCLVDHQLIEKRSRRRQRRRDASSYVANVYLIRPASSIRKFNAGYTPPRAQKVSTISDQKLSTQPSLGDQFLSTQLCECSRVAHNKKEEDEEGEEDQISYILVRFAARKNDPTYQPDRQEREKVQRLLYEGYSVVQIVAAIDQAFDARPDNARPVRGFGFIVSFAHRRLSPSRVTTGTPTETLTGETPPTGAPAGASTEEPTGANHLSELDDHDPLGRVCALLHAASVQDLEGVEGVRYDLPGIRLGLRRFLQAPDPYSGNELYDAVLAAVSRGIQSERLVGYVEAVLENARAEVRERERLRQRTAETAHIVQDDGKRLPEAPSRLLVMEQDARYPPPDKEALARWQSALSELELQMTRATFNTWLKPTTLLAWETEPEETRVILAVPNGYVKDWLENRLLTPIQRTLHGIVGQPVEIAFQVDGAQEQMQ